MSLPLNPIFPVAPTLRTNAWGGVDGFGHFVNAGKPDHVVCDHFGAVAFGWGGVSDALVGSLTVVVKPEPVQQLLEMVHVEDGVLRQKASL